MDKKSYKELITKRVSVKGQITKFKNYLNTFSDLDDLTDIQLTELTLKLAKFESLSVRFDDLQTEIEVLDPDNISIEIEERESIEREIIINIATAKNFIELFNKKNESEQRQQHEISCCLDHRQQEVSLKLPQIQIAKFDGAYFRWMEFRDTFENLIHNNDLISPVNKFHYLISYLQGDAARIVSNLEVSNKNYSEAWSLLCSRYNNKRILINQHLNALFNIKQLPRESERSLRFLVDHVTKNLRALTSLGQPTDKWDVLIIFMLTSKLDSNTLLKWEEYRNNIVGDVPTLDNFYKFLIDRADVLESLNRSRSDCTISRHPMTSIQSVPGHNPKSQKKPFIKSFATVSSKNNSYKKPIKFNCIICDENHRIYDCPTFKAKGVDERLKDVIKFKLCKNCLRQGHPDNECRMGPCRVCSERHNSLLHHPSPSNSHVMCVDEQEQTLVNYSNQNNQVLLSTAMIEATNPFNHQKVKVRALLDCGSQSSFISKSLKNRLSLLSKPIDPLKVIGIGNTTASNVVESCNVQLKSINTDFKVSLSCLVMNDLTGYLPKMPINICSIKLPEGIDLADPTFYLPAPIDVLIGADVFWDLIGHEQHSISPHSLKLRSTRLGWIVSGPIPVISNNNNMHCNQAIVSKSNLDHENINKILTKFWDLEEVPLKKIMSDNDKYCEKHFLTHTTRDSTGRFTVRLPLKDTPDCLGDTYQLAKRRFINLEKQFKRNSSLKLQYTEFINEYAALGHLSILHTLLPNPSYFLCHHAVFRESSETTKVRVVFDGSAPSSSGYSVNDLQLVGPNIQDSLFAILLRARQHKYLLTGDVEKMYRQVNVHVNDRNLQLILWREQESSPIKTLQLNTVTYGTASASFLSTRCLWQIGEECDDDVIKTIIQRDFYVDDLITGSDNKDELLYIQNSVSTELHKGCFNLRKYKSNCPSIFNNIDINDQDNFTISESTSTLGLGWTPSSDTFHFPSKIILYNCAEAITKRFIMSSSFKIFDPLGLLSPIIIIPKIILQSLWKYKLDWDQPVPLEIKNDWIEFTDNLKLISNMKIPRRVLADLPLQVELHSFSDASQSAYGACIYMKSISPSGKFTVRLLCAKSKVAPLKPTTIPRLELQGALLAAKLTKSVLSSIRYRPGRIVHWCDSSVVLGWINSDPTKLKVFVANRVSEITELTDFSAWRYVPTASNPADLISRGTDAKHLIHLDLWWSGPTFLLRHESEWPLLNANDSQILPEIKSNTLIISEPIINFEKFSSLNRLQRAFAYLKRFIFNLKFRQGKRTGSLTADELRESFHGLCVIAQSQSFPIEYEQLAKGKELNNKGKILSLSPFMDSDKLIRVGGRIQAANCPFEKKHPILLHASHKLTKLYFEREHINGMHSGPQLLLATVRETIWPVNGRHLARRTVNNCIRCRRLRGRTLYPKMGNLPSQRINPDFPFLSVGLDFAGPFHIINRTGRGCREIKCYLCLFVCLRYKCIHLEAVSDLTKDAFIMTLRRFIARRGKPIEVVCDNGTNFVAAAKEIGDFLNQTKEPMSDFASQLGINFKFIPAYSPHFGGIYEAGVKSAKHHLKRVVGQSHLTFEEISTLFAQVEAILNSRPLCPLSSSPEDLLPLSPGHFIIGRPLTALPSPALEECKDHQLKRYQRLEKIRQQFWKRWQKEYLSELQQRTKWRINTSKLSVGDMVLLAEDNSSPLQWRLGRVLRLIPGPDQTPRVADVQTSRGCVRRSFVRLCPLPTPEELRC